EGATGRRPQEWQVRAESRYDGQALEREKGGRPTPLRASDKRYYVNFDGLPSAISPLVLLPDIAGRYWLTASPSPAAPRGRSGGSVPREEGLGPLQLRALRIGLLAERDELRVVTSGLVPIA